MPGFMRNAIAMLAVLAGLSSSACNRSNAGEQAPTRTEEPIRALKTVQVTSLALPRELLLTGTLVADRHSDLAANASGRVLATQVERGQQVAAGDVVAVLDARVAKYSAKAAAAQSKVAKAQLELAALECDRADRLLASGTISQTEYDRTKSQCATTQSSLSAAASTAALASVQAGDSVIKAPFGGIVGERFIDVGEYVQPSTRVISLYSVDPIRVSIGIPEADLERVQAGQNVTFTVTGLGDRTFTATIKYLGAALRESTRDLVVEAVAANPDNVLRPGMFATVRLTTSEVAVPTVPQTAVFRKDGRELVWTVRQGRAIAQLVRTGTSRGGFIAILAGVTTDDRVVLDPPADLADGTKLE